MNEIVDWFIHVTPIIVDCVSPYPQQGVTLCCSYEAILDKGITVAHIACHIHKEITLHDLLRDVGSDIIRCVHPYPAIPCRQPTHATMGTSTAACAWDATDMAPPSLWNRHFRPLATPTSAGDSRHWSTNDPSMAHRQKRSKYGKIISCPSATAIPLESTSLRKDVVSFPTPSSITKCMAKDIGVPTPSSRFQSARVKFLQLRCRSPISVPRLPTADGS